MMLQVSSTVFNEFYQMNLKLTEFLQRQKSLIKGRGRQGCARMSTAFLHLAAFQPRLIRAAAEECLWKIHLLLEREAVRWLSRES